MPASDHSPAVLTGRHVADPPPGTVLFLIGMRVNELRKIRQWLPVARAAPRMLADLPPSLPLARPAANLRAHNETPYEERRSTVWQATRPARLVNFG